jgi:radical SAM protein with 4Fe4S-binding SPASM domain
MCKILNKKDLFVYPYDMTVPPGKLCLLYSPMTRKAVWLTNETAKILDDEEITDRTLQHIINELSDFVPLKNRTRKVRNIEDYPLLTVLPNQKCNLNCSYCYSAKGRSDIELDIGKLKHAIDFFINSKKQDRPLSISYMGGGEPMLSWNLVHDSIIYAGQKAKVNAKYIDFTIITNGTLMTDTMLTFIRKNNINISISFDILEEIQDKQRGQYQTIINNIQKLISHHIIPQINATITPDNVERMLEMYHQLDEKFPEITNMMFEPVTAADLFPKSTDLSRFLKIYTDNFLAIDREVHVKGKSLTSFPYLRTVYPTERACAGEFCLTANGKLSGCYCISTSNDTAYHKVIYGEVFANTVTGNHKIAVDREIFRNLLDENVYSKEKCKDCTVKWNCGGGCFYLYNTYPEEYRDVFCDFTKEFVQKIVLKRFERLYEKRFGVSPIENISRIRSDYTILNVK